VRSEENIPKNVQLSGQIDRRNVCIREGERNGLGQMLPTMRSGQVLLRADWDNTGWVDVVVRDVVVPLDMVEIHSFGDTTGLVQVAKIAGEVGVVGNPSDIALEMAVIDRVEPNQRDKKPPVGLHEFRSE
jgi:hypothetical protein